MELERIPMEFRDFVAYLAPGFVLLLAIVLAGWLGPPERISTFHPSVLILGGAVFSYIVGQAIYVARVFVVKVVRRLAGDPRTYLIGSVQSRPIFLKLFFVGAPFKPIFQSELLAELGAYWGESLVEKDPLGVYRLCRRFIRQYSPANAHYVDRSISLRNMHGAMVLPTTCLAIVLFVQVHAILLGSLCLIAALFFLRNCYSNAVEEARIVYQTFYLIRHESALKGE